MDINDETFRLVLDGYEVPIASDYTVHAGVLEVPATFDMTIGHAALLCDLVDRFPAFTPFQLYVGDTVVQTGETDGWEPSGSDGSELKIHGKDLLRRLVKKQLASDRSFAEKTYSDLLEIALAEVGLGTVSVVTDNTANRKAITGSQNVKAIAPTTTEDTIEPAGTDGGRKVVARTIQGERGTSWWDLLNQQFRRAGLFVWAAVDGTFVLARPNGQQRPLYRILRRRGKTNEPGEVTVLGQPSFKFDSNQRYTECHVVGMSGGGKDGHGAVVGRAFDREMFELLNPSKSTDADFARFKVLASKALLSDGERAELGQFRREELFYTDKKCQTVDQCAFLARRKIAESRRSGWTLTYTVSGHTAPSLLDAGQSVVWAPDTVVHVVDDELGLDGPMYVESLVYKRQPHTTTEVNLLRIEDLVFAEEDIDRPPVLAKKKGIAHVRVGKTEVWRVQGQWRRDPNWGNLPVRVRDTFKGLNSGVGEAEGDFVPDIEARKLR